MEEIETNAIITSLFPEDFRVLNFKDVEKDFLDYFNTSEVTEIGFKEILILRKCRGAKTPYLGSLREGTKYFGDENFYYFGLSIDQAKKVAEDNRENGAFFRLIPTPCLTLECKKYKISFFDKMNFFKMDLNKLDNLISGKNITERRSYLKVITYLQNVGLGGGKFEFSKCFLIAPHIELKSCEKFPRGTRLPLETFHYVSESSNSGDWIKWEHLNFKGEIYQGDE